jgi:hypothetical protein
MTVLMALESRRDRSYGSTILKVLSSVTIA